jgi:hypothetical protein
MEKLFVMMVGQDLPVMKRHVLVTVTIKELARKEYVIALADSQENHANSNNVQIYAITAEFAEMVFVNASLDLKEKDAKI